MANRYFIASGATANWNDINSWSETSGGAVGATVPTSVDNAIFDANSLSAPCNLTINAEANCLNLDFSGLDNLLTLTNSAFNLNVYGNLTLTSNTYLNTAFSGTGYLQLRATTSVNITSNGCTRAWNRVYFNGIGGTWTNQDDWSYNTQTHLINGTWNTNDKTITTTLLWFETGVKTLTLGSSTFNCVNINYLSSGGSLTINAGTSIINTSNIPLYGSLTLYTLNITSTSLTSGIAGIVSLTNLSIQSSSTVASSISLMNNITVSNNLTLEGANNNNFRLLLYSTALGTPRTITVNGSIIASNVDFRDIRLAGTASRDLSAITGGSGDCGGNSGITFTPAANQYFKHSGSTAVNWSDTTKWFTTSGGSVQGRVPLPQDDAIFDANSFDANCTLNVNVPRIGGLNMEGVNQTVVFSLSSELQVYKSFVFGNNLSRVGTFTISLFGRSSHILKTFNKLFHDFNLYGVNGFYTVQSNISCSGIRVYAVCTFDVNDYDINLLSLFNFGYPGVNIFLGNGTIKSTRTVNGGALFSFANSNLNAEGSTLICESSGTTETCLFQGGGKTFNKVRFAGTHRGFYNIEGSNSINELIIDSGKKIQFTNGTTQTISKLTSNGTPDNKVTIQSTTAGSQATINYTGLDTPFIPNVVLKDINFTVPVYALNGTNLGNNTNVKYVWKVAKKTMGFPIRLVKDE